MTYDSPDHHYQSEDAMDVSSSNAMEVKNHSGIYVAPLQISKDCSRTSSNTSSCSQRTLTHKGRQLGSRKSGNITPPLTPQASVESLHARCEASSQPAFHTYLRAFYAFHPICDDSSSTITLPLNYGDIILIHSVHTNGWADGTLLSSGARGWLPTNYCEAYSNEPAGVLLKALTKFWDLAKGSSLRGLTALANQDYVRGLVAGVRCLLERTNCLNRDSSVIQSHRGLRRNRKALLSDLSSFVKTARLLEGVAAEQTAVAAIDLTLDEVIMKAFKVVIRGVKFLDIWHEDMVAAQSIVNPMQANMQEVPPTPPADCADFGDAHGQVGQDEQRSAPLRDAREDMYRRICELVEAARDIFGSDRVVEEQDIILQSEETALVEAATACVRAAGECVAESRYVLEQIGDFVFEPFDLDISSLQSQDLAANNTAFIAPVLSQQIDHTKPDMRLPAEPSIRPPPPPTEPEHQARETDNSLEEPSKEPSETADASGKSSGQSLLPPLPAFASPLLEQDDYSPSVQSSFGSSNGQSSTADSVEHSSLGGSSTYIGSLRGSESSAVSQTSTRATSPDHTYGMSSVCDSLATSSSTIQDDCEEVESKLLERTFAHELVYNKDGQISGGTLPALIERLTTHDSTPDASFVSTFFLTFRLFATPCQFAQALIDRFQYVAESPRIAGPVRLRVYNVFKGWLESHWRNDCDSAALELIVPFATRQLLIVLPTAGKRLAALTEKVNAADGPLVPRLVSSMGKTNTSIANYVAPDTPLPPAILTKHQMTLLKSWKYSGATISILDFDPLELARQLTLKESRIFCSILPEELLATEWTKKTSSMAVNVRAMSRLSTDLANLVADSILQLEDPKKRAVIIKQWVKIAKKCLQLENYDSLMAIICSLNSSTILRLKRTWDHLSSKTKTKLDTLKDVVNVGRNHATLRQRLQNTIPPCIPFVGIYLTDLTFVDVGNQTTRQLAVENKNGVGDDASCVPVINFGKHIRTAKIISELQRFQIPYRFTEVPELQTWIQDQLVRVRSSEQSNVQNYYRRSCLLEPRETGMGTGRMH
ncbi:MAG: hypothetical protein Q9220_004052 [cf. Caloplaca sp. 1 TL-2023]